MPYQFHCLLFNSCVRLWQFLHIDRETCRLQLLYWGPILWPSSGWFCRNTILDIGSFKFERELYALCNQNKPSSTDAFTLGMRGSTIVPGTSDASQQHAERDNNYWCQAVKDQASSYCMYVRTYVHTVYAYYVGQNVQSLPVLVNIEVQYICSHKLTHLYPFVYCITLIEHKIFSGVCKIHASSSSREIHLFIQYSK